MMNLPNKLTLARVLLIPVFVVLMLPERQWAWLAAAVVFVVASLTDLLDGYLARKHNLVTDFGKLMDPMADKLLVMAALISLLQLQLVNAIAVMILLGREFIIMSIRLVAAGKGTVIAADKLGKIKTALQISAITALLIGGALALGKPVLPPAPFLMLGNLLIWASAVMSIWSCVSYIMKNREVLRW